MMDFLRKNEVGNTLEDYRYIASVLRLRDSYLFFKYKDEDINRICNGIGPEWFPASVRRMVDKLHPSIVVPAWLHDLRYYNGTGAIEDFDEANENFLYNCNLVIEFIYPKWNPCRWFAKRSARRFYRMCKSFGQMAYNNAIEERKLDSRFGVRDDS